MLAVKTPDDAIRLAKQLAFMMKCLARELEVDLDEAVATISSDDKTLLTINAGSLVQMAEGLQYGQLGEGNGDD